MNVTTLVENTRLGSHETLQPEHGLSLHIHHKDQHILFDTGSSGVFLKNAQILDIDIQNIDAVVISHHHYDHGGGLKAFFETNSEARVYMQPIENGRLTYRAFGGLKKRYIGLDTHLFEKYPDRFAFLNKKTEIVPGVFIITEIERPYPTPMGNRYLFTEKGDKNIRDPFNHELIMVIKDSDGLVLFSGCSHSGILNMVETVKVEFPGQQIKAVLGGFHLIDRPVFHTMMESRKEVQRIGEKLCQFSSGRVFTGHCTGEKAFKVLKEIIGERLEAMPTGSRIKI